MTTPRASPSLDSQDVVAFQLVGSRLPLCASPGLGLVYGVMSLQLVGSRFYGLMPRQKPRPSLIAG